ncbi:phage tail protein E [Klebsiella pneumoniae]|uniref:Phage tail protein E n=1 Tax=Klebsiella pneumoniae TaxID=573 RepID=A0A377U5D6_KLEPN|nr:phage tail protein E [Klebsiella pneumoniae]
MEMDVASMMTVIPRISTPTLTPQEMADLDPADLAAMSVEVVLFCCRSRHLPICRQPDGR